MLLKTTIIVAALILGSEFAKWFHRRYGRDLFHPHPDDLRATKTEPPA